MRVGVTVSCEVCHRTKAPRGRSIPLSGSYCTDGDCEGYGMTPRVGDLWSGETEKAFGYPVSEDGTKENGS